MKLEEMKITELFDTSHTIAARLFEGKTYPWEVLADLGSFIEQLGATLPEKEYRKIGKNIWVHRTARMAPPSRSADRPSSAPEPTSVRLRSCAAASSWASAALWATPAS